ncbi:MAG: hypothetical protein LBT12_07720 [Oscillospiraceae bacterium]|nr:hypothetical protein [Oscillospiraceae bacterium]
MENAVATTVSGELISDTLSVAPEEGVERAMIVLGQKEQKDYFLLSRVRDKWFSISILGANILFEGESPVSEGKYLLFPQHWMRDARLKDGAVPVAYEGVEYELNPNVSMQTFFDFYNDSGWFDVKIENDAFVLEASSTTLMHPYNQKYQAPYPIRFSFSSHVGMEYLKIERDVSTE